MSYLEVDEEEKLVIERTSLQWLAEFESFSQRRLARCARALASIEVYLLRIRPANARMSVTSSVIHF